ncbi:TrmB family transcriptional regulator [Halomicrobium salinisoli]|uniref:TrmB family transcriptional regulator n=1 Tax=Halomicrobium salinisoli TaxID=2878391 RepID=UPI001CF0345B|nr:helix-turn-helix domain-containing protein [Halomicrobium salinisoli]
MSDLTDLGLSSYEAHAYRALLSLGPATAREVAEAGDVPMGRIYDVLNGLSGRDLVTARDGDPTRYVAADPDAATDRLLAERRAELRDRLDRYEAVAASVGEELAPLVPTESQFWSIGLGGEAAATAMREQFERATESIRSVVAAPYDAAAAADYEAEVEAYLERVDEGLEVELLTTPSLVERGPTDRLAAALESAADFALRTTSPIHLTYEVLDDREVYVDVPAPFAAGERVGGVVVRDGDAAAEFETRFREAWADATPVEPADLAE